MAHMTDTMPDQAENRWLNLDKHLLTGGGVTATTKKDTVNLEVIKRNVVHNFIITF